MVSDAETQVVAVERVREYCDLPAERSVATGVTQTTPPADWPSSGAVRVRGLSVGYRVDTPLVLRGIDLDIRPGERIGICGRTGSGKSSLLGALFRATDVQGGHICIDGLDIGTVPVTLLRSRLTLIPQVCARWLPLALHWLLVSSLLSRTLFSYLETSGGISTR